MPVSLTTEMSILLKDLKDGEGCRNWFLVKMVGSASDFRLSFNMFFLLLDVSDQQRGYLQTISLPWTLTSPLNPETLQHPPVSENAPDKYLEELLYPQMIKPGHSDFAVQ